MNGTWWVDPGQLDRKQLDVIELPLDGSYLVLGAPGSGKTNLLLLRANFLTRAGRPDVQIIVFTRTLRDFIASGADRYAFREDKIRTYNGWVLNFLREHGMVPDATDDFTEQRKRRLAQVMSVVDQEQIVGLYDVILLDEAHDYSRAEIELFRRLGRNFFATADLRQQIYQVTDEPVECLRSLVDETVELPFHYRTGRAICKLADGITRHTGRYKPMIETCNYDEVRYPSSVKVFPCDDLSEQCRAVIAELGSQLDAYPNELIGVVCPRHDELATISQQLSNSAVSRFCTFQNTDSYISFDRVRPICVCTVHSSKGLEFRALHFVACDTLHGFGRNRNMAFTGFTRAKTSLSIYHSGNLHGYIESALAAMNPPPALPGLDEVFGSQS